MAVNNRYAEPVEAETAQRRLVAAASGDMVAFEQVNLANFLFNEQRFSEALELVARYERRDAVSSTLPTRTRVQAVFQAGIVRCAMGDFDLAQDDLRLAEDLVRGLDMPEVAILIGVQQAAVDRALGSIGAAGARLRRIIDDPVATPAGRAYAAWLSAVMAREAGNLTAASRLVEDAWAIVVSDARDEFDLVLQCLLERAIQVTEADPQGAVRLIGLVIAHRDGEVFYHGVDYEPESRLADLRARLGDDQVDQILAEIVDQPLPNAPAWGYLTQEKVRN